MTDWGGPARMSAWESVMWRADGDPRTRSTGVLYELLESTPPWEAFVAAHENAVRAVPRLTQRVVAPVLPVGTPQWTADPEFDLGYHLQRVRLPEPATYRALLDLAGQFTSRPIDPTRPPWEVLLVEGLPDGRAAYLLKIHHAMTDGLGLMRLIELTHAESPAPPLTTTGSTPPGPFELTGRQLAERVTGLPSSLARTGRSALTEVARTCRKPAGRTGRALRYGASLRRTAAPPPVGRSPLLAEGGTRFHLMVHEVPLADLKAAGKATGGSVNDVFLAAVLGAFRRYHERMGVDVDRMPIGFPISVRRESDPAGGNRFAGARFAAPVGEPDPVERVRQIREFVAAARQEPAIGFLDVLAPVLNQLPTSMLTAMAARMTTALDLQASNIPGPAHPLRLAGSRVERLYPIGPRPGVAAMVTMVSYDGICCLGVNADPDSIRDTDAFLECLREGFDEVLALA